MSTKLSNPVSNYVSGVYQPTLEVELDCPSVKVDSTYKSLPPSSFYYSSRNIFKLGSFIYFNYQLADSSTGSLGIYNIENGGVGSMYCPYDTFRGCFIGTPYGVYMFGGFKLTSYTNNNAIMKYDFDQVTTISATIPVALRQVSACLIGSYIYIVGGYTGSASVNTIYRLNIETDTLETMLYSLNYATHRTALSVYENRYIYVSGGVGTEYKTQIIDIELGMVTTDLINLPKSFIAHGSMIKDDYLYIFGGVQDGVDSSNVYKKYLLDSGDWELDSNLSFARDSFGYCSDENGYYHIIGGHPSGEGQYYETGRFGLPSSDVQIRYTQTDDDTTPPDPTETDTLYNEPIELSSATKHKIKAKAFYVGV